MTQPVITDKMVLLELEFGRNIRELIRDGSAREVADRLGVDFSTIAKWRKRLGIKES